MRGGQLFGGGFADVGNRQRENPARKRRGAASVVVAITDEKVPCAAGAAQVNVDLSNY